MTPSVVHVASGREWRGGQRQVWLLARELQRSGFANQVVVTGAGTQLAYRLRHDGVRVHEARWTMGLDPRVLLPVLRELRGRGALLHAHDAHAVTLAGLCGVILISPLVRDAGSQSQRITELAREMATLQSEASSKDQLLQEASRELANRRAASPARDL